MKCDSRNSIPVVHVAICLARKEEPDRTPYGYYAVLAFCYGLAMVCSTAALRHIPYPMQVVGKSAKPIPVMLLAVLIGRKRYTPQRYIFVTAIVTGVVLFVFNPNKTTSTGDDKNPVMGYILLATSLTMDGLMGAVQERVRTVGNPSPFNMMCSTNKWAVGYLGTYVLLQGEYCRFYGFVERNLDVLWLLAIVVLATTIGQIFIFYMITSFGSLSCSIVTTSRKFLTVLFSLIVHQHALAAQQWVGLVIVFGFLFADAYFDNHKKHTPDDEDPENGQAEIDADEKDGKVSSVLIKEDHGQPQEMEALNGKPAAQ